MTKFSTITCPNCGHQSNEMMPEDACQFFWQCIKCGKVIKPKDEDCCVFCSYGDTACSPVQLEQLNENY